MSRAYFDRELEALHTDLIKMGALIEEAIAKSVKALDPKNRDLARDVAAGDKSVDDMETQIETRCMRLLLLQQPVAKDLRAISAAIKMITDMERIGDQAADIADIALRLGDFNLNSYCPHLQKMALIAIEMVSDSITAFINSDLELARNTMKKDDEVDRLFDLVKNELIDSWRANCALNACDMGNEAVDSLMIAKYLERIGDHAENICEWVEFYETGIHKKGANPMNREDSL